MIASNNNNITINSIGVKWIKQKYGEELRIIRIGQKGYLETIEQALIHGSKF